MHMGGMAAMREELRWQPIHARVRALARGDRRVVADTTAAVLVWEPGHYVPSYAIPGVDVAVALVAAEQPSDEHTAPGTEFVAGGDETRRGSVYRLSDPDLASYFVFTHDDFEWLEEDDEVIGHPRDPYHRVDVRRSSRHVRIVAGRDVLVDTTRARMLFETGFPFARLYVPREDVAVPLTATDARSVCPYKGEASYWTAEVGGRLLTDVAWTYDAPLDGAAAIAGLVCFYHERFETTIDPAPNT